MVSFCIPVYNIDAGVVGTVVVLEEAVPMVAIEDINLILTQVHLKIINCLNTCTNCKYILSEQWNVNNCIRP